jgi:tripartite-type tricarboxylate transporter receptor subunit TctC
MRLARRQLLRLGAALVALPWQQAKAQSYPSRPLRWVVGFPPGGAADIVARIVTQPLAERLGQPMIIDNKPGGASNIAAQTVVTAPPDGYTLFLASTSNAINASLYQSLPFDFPRDFAPVAGVSAQPLVMVVNPTLPANSVDSFIAHAKANPGRINMASFGTGTISHLAGELFKSMAGVEMVHVPYRGGAAMVADLLGGQVQVAFDVLPPRSLTSGVMRFVVWR